VARWFTYRSPTVLLVGLLDGLDEAQRRAVTIDTHPLVIQAAAGSGKTRVLTRRIAHRIATGSADTDHVLALTFTRRAARELEERLGQLGVHGRLTTGTFHSVAWAQLQQRWADTGQRPWTLLDRPYGLLGELMQSGTSTRRISADPQAISETLSAIDWAAARRITPDRYETEATKARRRTTIPAARIASTYEAFRAEKRKRRLLDFTDMLEGLIGLMMRDPEAAAVQRWKFRHFFVDEFQDTNPVQFALLEAWRDGRSDLCIVGDVNQSVYGWNGADHRLLRDVEQHIASCTIVHLGTNYRSSPAIVRTASIALPASAQTHTVVALADDHDPVVGPVPAVHRYDDEHHEVDAVVSMVRHEIRGERPVDQVAVLARTNAQLEPIERALTAARIPVRRRDKAALHDIGVVKDWLHDAARSGEALSSQLADLAAIINDADLISDADARSLSRLMELGARFTADHPLGTASGFAGWVGAQRDDAFTEPGVDLATFHAAKGLEWDTVFIIGAEDGWFPMRASTAAARDEEARLAYVAMSRPSRRLVLTWAATRDGMIRVPSPYLTAIEALGVELTAEQAPAPPPPLIDRTTRDATATPDIRGALVQWRRDQARASSVDEHAVLADQALLQLADNPLLDPGAVIGPVKAMRFGESLRQLLDSFTPTVRTGPADRA
jgi:DNA helicase II / ATP-dependent DNA helicase PcrA